MTMNLFTEPKIDCHVHVFDPVRFPYAADTAYAPQAPRSAPPTTWPRCTAHMA